LYLSSGLRFNAKLGIGPLASAQSKKKKTASTPAVNECRRRYFGGDIPISPVIVLKNTRHKGKFPEASRHSALVHGISGSRTSRLLAKKTKQQLFFSKNGSYSGPNTQHGYDNSPPSKKWTQSRFGSVCTAPRPRSRLVSFFWRIGSALVQWVWAWAWCV
jgi:hypothetical protein